MTSRDLLLNLGPDERNIQGMSWSHSLRPRRHNRSYMVSWDLSVDYTWHIHTQNELGQKWGWVLAQDAEKFCLPNGWVPGIKGAGRTQISLSHVPPMAVSGPHALREYTGYLTVWQALFCPWSRHTGNFKGDG